MKYLIGLLCIIVSTKAYCQINAIHVFSSASYFYSSSNVRINWAVGELFPETLTSNSLSISPGINDIEAIYLITDLEPSYKNLIGVSPIPFTNELTVSLGENGRDDVNWRISLNDLSGNVLSVPYQMELNDIKLDAKNISSGLYLLKIETNSEVKIFKVIKQ